MTYLTKAKHLLRDLKVSGCRRDEIVDLEKELNIFLPEAYQEFLLWMGENPDKFLVGDDVTYPVLPKLQRGANEILEENNQKELPENSFVFWMHQGYTFTFFILNESDDPTVYLYDEQITRGWESLEIPFSQWLINEVEFFCDRQRVAKHEEN